ncbi:hypothetical protein [Mycobacterium avium]|nr:hypothetical protein [Mycobacterium avium]
MATPNTMRAITAPIAICVRRGFNEKAGTDSSPIARFAVVSKYPRRPRFSRRARQK